MKDSILSPSKERATFLLFTLALALAFADQYFFGEGGGDLVSFK